LHLDGVGQGDELALAVEVGGDDGSLDVGDHVERLLVTDEDEVLRRAGPEKTVGSQVLRGGIVASRRRGVERRRARERYGGRSGGGGTGAS
jgi:hypothetical protein